MTNQFKIYNDHNYRERNLIARLIRDTRRGIHSTQESMAILASQHAMIGYEILEIRRDALRQQVCYLRSIGMEYAK